MEILAKIEEKVRKALDKITLLQEENDKLKQINAEYEEKLLDLLADLEQVESEEVQITDETETESVEQEFISSPDSREEEEEPKTMDPPGSEIPSSEAPASTSFNSLYGS